MGDDGRPLAQHRRGAVPGLTGAPLTVVSVAYPLAPVGPDAVGGAEQVLSALDRALVAEGHRSVVVAAEGSVVAGRLAAIPAVAPGAIGPEAAAAQQACVRHVLGTLLATGHVDLVHMHGLDFAAYLPAPGVPVLATLHLPPDWYADGALEPARPLTWVHGVSASQHALLPPGALPPVANGVDVARLAAAPRRPGGPAVMLARICPEKGVHLALQAAHAADAELVIAGQVFPYPAHEEYFENQVRPLLDARRRWAGPLGFAAKRRLLAGARCLLVPSLCAETSSLVAMEAASCGTPVIAFARGALPEVVEHGRTGFLVDDVGGLAAAIGRVATLDPATIRTVARRRFGHAAMAGAYLRRYRLLLQMAAQRSAA